MKDNKDHVYNSLLIDYAQEWLIPGSDDEKGHNIGKKFYIQKTWLAQMDRILKSQKIPYINKGQIVRHALFMLFTWIDTLEEKQLPTSDLKRIASMRTLLLEEAMLVGFNDVMSELAKQVKYCKARGMHKRAVRHVLDVLRIAEGIQEDDWREHFVNKIKGEYKMLLDSVSDVELYKIENED